MAASAHDGSPFQQSSVPGERLVDMLYRNIRDYVLFSTEGAAQGRLYPHELCEKFHATATPVREALARLAAEGFIEATPRRGFHVRRPSEQQVTDLWQVRGGLEVMAGELAIEQLKQGALAMSELDKLELVLQSITATADAIDGRQHIERNRQFHGSIVERQSAPDDHVPRHSRATAGCLGPARPRHLAQPRSRRVS